jgi:hypothetical protein
MNERSGRTAWLIYGVSSQLCWGINNRAGASLASVIQRSTANLGLIGDLELYRRMVFC